jgi:glycosyltransferase involved in cell wall biosynthesis
MPALDIAIQTSGLRITGEDPMELSLGGAESAVVWMARALARRGHRVTVLCHTDPGGREAGGVSYLPAGECGGGDVFVAARCPEALAAAHAAALRGLWHHDPPCAEIAARLRPVLADAAFAFFLSRFQRDAYARLGLAGGAVLSANGVDFAAADDVARAAPEGEPGPRFLYASRPSCGLETLLQEIWPRIRRRLPEAELLVTSYDIASLPDPARLERARRAGEVLARAIAASPGVRAVGPLVRRDLWREMARSAAVLYPTDTPEVSCLVALEAQALGVPIVTTARFAFPETVGFAAALIAAPWGTAEYAEDFAGTAVQLVTEPDFRAAARAAGRRHVTPATHSWDVLAGAWSDLFAARLAGGEAR